jgi:DNA-binding response OmpR family regulator
MNTHRILIAEDDTNICNGIDALLQGEGYATLTAKDGEEALRLYAAHRPDLIVLDIMMPRKSGYDVCKAIRATDPRTPVIMLTAKGEEIDKVLGLELGADDYITKPFGIREFAARVAAVLRRRTAEKETPAAPAAFDIGDAHIDPSRYEVQTSDGRAGAQRTQISDKEMKLLIQLHQHRGDVLTRDALLNAVWGISYFGNTRTLDQHIAQLRKKLGKSGAFIQTVHGIGYRLLNPDKG